MRQIATLALLGIFSVLPCFAQGAQTDAQTLQSILVELRAIHDDVRLSQASQILLAEMQVAQAAVEKATQRRDDIKMKVSNAQNLQKSFASQLARIDESAGATIDETQKKRIADNQEQLKAMIANQQIEEQARTNDLTDADNALRKAQETLTNIQGQLNDVMKKLQP